VRVVLLGLSITSSWGNGHATNFRGLQRALTRRGHDVLFLERDAPWYAAHRDLPSPPWGTTELYSSLPDLRDRFSERVADADVVLVGSYVPDGIEVGNWVNDIARVAVFYDIDTPVTLGAVERGACEYIDAELIARFDLYLSFTGGPMLRVIEQQYGSPQARAFYCLVDADAYVPAKTGLKWDLGYLGTYSDDRQRALDELLIEPARQRPELRFVVAGSQYPDSIEWPANVERIDHLPPSRHPEFYCSQRFTLNVTRADMATAGWSPSVRLFEAAACAVPTISDRWDGIETFFTPRREILLAGAARDVLDVLDSTGTGHRDAIGHAARARVLAAHTAEHRAAELESHILDLDLVPERT
jgi:spore maturation protein CgeB